MKRLFWGAATLAAMVTTATVAAVVHNLATVDGQAIPPDTLRRAAAGLGSRGDMMLANPTLRRQLLDHVIEDRLLAKAAAAAGVERDPEYQTRLADARVQILATLYSKQYVDAHTRDADLQAFFAKDPVRFSAKEVHGYHILVKDQAAALKVLAEATAKGADFEALARKYSQGPSAPHGGDLGFFRRGRMLPEFDAAAFATAPGTVHPALVKTEFGFHVIKVAEVRGNDDVKFADVKERVREVLEAQVKDDLIGGLKIKAKVAVDEDAVRMMPFAR